MVAEQDADALTIKRLVEEQIEAYNRGDAAGFLSHIAEDRISMNPGQGVTVGRGVVDELQEFFNTVEQVVSLDIDEIVVFGDWAFERGTGKGTLSPRAATNGFDPAASYHYKYIRVWNKRGGSWKVARSIWNASPPQ